MSRSAVTCLAGTFVLLASGLVGCAMPLASKDRAAEVEGGPPQATCTLDLRSAKGSSKVSQVEIPADATVQQVLTKSGAHRKFARMNVELYRRLPTGAWHKMDVVYDRSSKRVDPLHDYHVQPGDRLMVTEDTTDMLDDMAESLGVFGGKLR